MCGTGRFLFLFQDHLVWKVFFHLLTFLNAFKARASSGHFEIMMKLLRTSKFVQLEILITYRLDHFKALPCIIEHKDLGIPQSAN